MITTAIRMPAMAPMTLPEIPRPRSVRTVPPTSPVTPFYSPDRGHPWSSAVTVTTNANNNSQDAIPSTGPDGSVYVTFDTADNHGVEYVMIAKSTDGGATFGTNYLVATMVNPVL